MRLAALALALVILSGCLRVGEGEDLHLVCEEKSASPRKAYGIEHLVDATRVEGQVDDATKLALLEAARQHIVTPRGAPHAGFTATLAETNGSWTFHGIGVWEDEPQDEYRVLLSAREGGVVALAPVGPGPVLAPRTLVDAAWAAVNASPEASGAAGGRAPAWGAWDPELPSCVSLGFASSGASPEARAVANIVQGRIVDVG